MKLNTQQRAAVLKTNNHCLVLAGAGSGKTRVITEKIAHLINNDGISPKTIVAVTFTNKAAQEMQARIRKLINQEQAKDLHISTFHTLGLNILRREFKTLDYKKGFTIFDSTDVQSVLREVLRSKELSFHGDETAACWAISRLKNDLMTAQTALDSASDANETDIALLYSRYQTQLHAYNAFDFDDLILQPVLLFQNHPEILKRWQNKIQYLLVDEYQDTNSCQYELVKLLLGKSAKLTAVGDDDQSIYAWRGAKPENLQRLCEDYAKIKIIKLEQNYRSAGRILKCANQLISNNPHVFEKKLWSELGYGDAIRVLPCQTAEDEAAIVVAELLHNKFQYRCRNKDFAILYRSNHQSRLLESCLRMHNLPYTVSGGTAFFDRAEIKDILSYLRLLINPNDDAAFLRVINTPRREIGASTLEKLALAAKELDLSLLETCRSESITQYIRGAALTRLSRFTDWLNEVEIQSRTDPAHSIANRIVSDTDYSTWLLNSSKDKETAQRRNENVTSLLDWIRNIAQNPNNKEEMLLEALVAKLTLMDILDRQEQTDESDTVQLITIHAAKGLEFPHVFLIGAEEGMLPHHSSEQDGMIEEERRLAYVAITRAQKSLTISYAESRKKMGESISCEPSRFLSELPLDELDWDGQQHSSGQVSEQDLKNRGNQSLSSLRELLNS